MEWWDCLLRMLLAVLIGTVIGMERERKKRPAGLRTHILVCFGAAMIAILESYMISETITLNTSTSSSGVALNMGRITAQVVSGIGFLGAGTIFVSKNKVAGLTTAASIWNVACLGLAAGMGFYNIAIAGCAVVLITLTIISRLVRSNDVKRMEITFIHRVETLIDINHYFENKGVYVIDVDFHVTNKDGQNVYTNTYTLDLHDQVSLHEVVNALSEKPNILGIRTRNT